ncbi:MAG: cupin domain-containing protein [Roseibium sp.]|nr:cupin domain-containing protein [Roseibium sp.]
MRDRLARAIGTGKGAVRTTTGAAICAAWLIIAPAALAQDGVSRTELNRADLTGSDTMEVIVSRLEVAPGARIPLHTHHGDEHLIVLQGGTMRAPNGQEIPFKPGMTAHFPKDQVHGGMTNIGDAPLVAYTTHIVEKGKPLAVPAE